LDNFKQVPKGNIIEYILKEEHSQRRRQELSNDTKLAPKRDNLHICSPWVLLAASCLARLAKIS
jgi:hypothetical protein